MDLRQLLHAYKILMLFKAQPAQNLLKSETYRKWRCAAAGEKQASVILEVKHWYKLNTGTL